MALKRKRKPATKHGPYLTAALICEKTLQESDGVLSAIRMIDHIALPPQPNNQLPEGVQVPIPITILVAFKAGSVKGEHVLKLVLTKTDGTRITMSESLVYFAGPEEGGVNFRANVNLWIEKEGLCWFDVILDGKRFTRIPLRVFFQRENAAEEV